MISNNEEKLRTFNDLKNQLKNITDQLDASTISFKTKSDEMTRKISDLTENNEKLKMSIEILKFDYQNQENTSESLKEELEKKRDETTRIENSKLIQIKKLEHEIEQNIKKLKGQENVNAIKEKHDYKSRLIEEKTTETLNKIKEDYKAYAEEMDILEETENENHHKNKTEIENKRTNLEIENNELKSEKVRLQKELQKKVSRISKLCKKVVDSTAKPEQEVVESKPNTNIEEMPIVKKVKPTEEKIVPHKPKHIKKSNKKLENPAKPKPMQTPATDISKENSWKLKDMSKLDRKFVSVKRKSKIPSNALEENLKTPQASFKAPKDVTNVSKGNAPDKKNPSYDVLFKLQNNN